MSDDVLDAIESVLVVGAHAFDAEVIAGPLAATAAARGIDVTLLHLSLGERGHPSLSTVEYREQKQTEAREAADLLGVRMETLGWPDGFLPSDDDAALSVCDVIRRTRADLVVTHWSGSWHKDHRAAYLCTQNAIFFASLPTLSRADPAHSPRLVLFGENWEDADGFAPDCAVDVSDGVEQWRAAIKAYELARGLTPFDYYDYYSALYRMRGCLASCDYAQAFRRQAEPATGGIAQVLRGSTTAEPNAGSTATVSGGG